MSGSAESAAVIFGETYVHAVMQALGTNPRPGIAAFDVGTVAGPVEPAMFERPALQNALSAREPLYVSMLGGTGLYGIGLVKQPVAFDFLLPNEPDEVIDPGSEVMTLGYLNASLRRRMAPLVGMLAAARAVIGGRMVQSEPPPPPEDDGYVAAHLPPDLIEPCRTRGLLTPFIRYKLWRVHSSLLRDACVGLGIGYVPVPPACLAAGRYLHHQYYAGPTNGNGAYGELILQQVEAL